MSPFWPIDHTADMGLRIQASSLAELLVEAAKGLTLFLIVEFQVRPAGWREIEVEAPDRDILLADFLSEILNLANVEGLATLAVEIDEMEETRLKARLGVKLLSELGGLKLEIKAVTYHGLKIEETAEGLEAMVVFDV